MTQNIKDIIRKYWKSVDNRDWTTFERLISENIVYDLPQTRERIRGRRALREFNETYPGDWSLSIVRLVVDEEGLGVSQIAFENGGEEQTGVSFFELHGGLIQRITEFWPTPYEPPARYTNLFERY